MMICWDAAHADLWQRYAGKVDAMVIASCPPKLSSADLVFPDGLRVNIAQLGSVWATAYTDEEHFPGRDMDGHAAWMGVPVVHTVGGGTFRSGMPLAVLSLGGYIAARPDLWGRLSQAPKVQIEAGFDSQTKVINAEGHVVARVTEKGDSYTVAEVTLADELPSPRTRPPAMHTSPFVYFLVDILGVHLATARYRRGVRRQWGKHMAPIDPRTKIWAGAVVGAAVLAWLSGLLWRWRK
jgi:hypothetical protein